MHTVFKINIPEQLRKPYYNVFGHFFLDHLFQIFKIKQWFLQTQHTYVDSMLIDKDTLQSSSFIEPFYKMLFDNVFTHAIDDDDYNIIDLGVIMGSKIDTETDVIYLSKSVLSIDIPSFVLDNGRKLTTHNKHMLNQMIHIIHNKLHINVNNHQLNDDKNILIINRSKPPRLLQNLSSLTNTLENKGYTCNIVSFDNLDLHKQIKLINSYKHIITACGSVQVHICFIQKNATYIELCGSGFRYPNTAIYGFFCDKKTYTLCSPLDDHPILNSIKNRNIQTKNLFDNDQLPMIIHNDIQSIDREKIFYSNFISMNCFDIHMIQNIDCSRYIETILHILDDNK